MDDLPYQVCGSVIKIRKMEQIQSKNGTDLYRKRVMDENFELSRFFKTVPCN